MKAPKRKSKYQIIVRGRSDTSGSYPLPHKPPKALRAVVPLPSLTRAVSANSSGPSSAGASAGVPSVAAATVASDRQLLQPAQKHISWRDLLRYSEALFFGVVYIITTTAEVSLVKGLNYHAHITLPIFTAIVLNQAWLVMVPGYIATYTHARAKDASQKANAYRVEARSSAAVQVIPGVRAPDSTEEVLIPLFVSDGAMGSHPATAVPPADRPGSALATPAPAPAPAPSAAEARLSIDTEPSQASLLKAYAGMGLIVYCVTMSRNYATNLLPGSTAALLMAGSMVWNVLLSKLLLKRRFKAAHYAAAAAGMLGIIALGAEAIPGLNPQSPGLAAVSGSALAIGLTAGAASGVFIALMSVTSSMVTKAWHRHRNLRVTEMTLFSSLIAVLLLVPTGWAVGEYGSWRAQIGQAMDMPGPGKVTVVLLTLAMPFNKAVVRSSKYATISHSSAFLFEFVQATAGITAAVVNILLFKEEWSYGIIASVLLLSLASVLYLIARRQEEADLQKGGQAMPASSHGARSCGQARVPALPTRRPAWRRSMAQQRWTWTAAAPTASTRQSSYSHPGSPAPAPALAPSVTRGRAEHGTGGDIPGNGEGMRRPLLASPTGFMESNLLQSSGESTTSMPYGGPFTLGVRQVLWPPAAAPAPPAPHSRVAPCRVEQVPLPLPGITGTGAIGPSEDLSESPVPAPTGTLLVGGLSHSPYSPYQAGEGEGEEGTSISPLRRADALSL